MTLAELKEKVQNILDELEENGKFFERVGIRTQDIPFEIGPIDHVSHRWDNGDDTGEELSGICVTDFCDVEEHFNGGYFGKYTAIIGGDFSEYGEDLGEIVLQNAEVICIL